MLQARVRPSARRGLFCIMSCLSCGLLVLSAGCTGQTGHEPATPSPSVSSQPEVTASGTPAPDAAFAFQQDADIAKDDLSALGAQQSGLPFDMIDLQTDYESLQVDQLSLQNDLESDNPNNACGDAAQGLTDRKALFNDQTGYGQDVSLATADMGRLDEDLDTLKKAFTAVVRIAQRSDAKAPDKLRSELLSVAGKTKTAISKMNATISRDNPQVTHWIKRGAAIYAKMRKACAAVR